VADVLVEQDVVAGQHRRLGVGEVAALVQVSAEAGVDQDLALDLRVPPEGVAGGGGEVGPGAVSDQDQGAFGGEVAGHGAGVVEGGGVFVFGGEAVVGRDDGQAGCGADVGADPVVGVEAADHVAAAVEVEDGRLGARVDPAGDAGDGLVVGGHSGRVGGVEGRAHPVVDRPLVGDGEGRGVLGVGGVGLFDEGPGGGVDEGLVVGHGGFRFGGECRGRKGAVHGGQDFGVKEIKGLGVGVRGVLRITLQKSGGDVSPHSSFCSY
jgi:hypothetical protein